MKRCNYIIYSLLLILLGCETIDTDTSCNEVYIPTVINVTTSMPLSSQLEISSRVDVNNTSSDGVWDLEWGYKDEMGGYSSDSEEPQSFFNKFVAGSWNDEYGKEADFTGVSNGSKLRLLYPYDDDLGVIQDGKYRVTLNSLSTNIVDKGVSRLGDNLLLISKDQIDVTSGENILYADMEHIGAVLELNLTFTGLSSSYYYFPSKITIIGKDSSIPSSAVIDLNKSVDDDSFLSDFLYDDIDINFSSYTYTSGYDIVYKTEYNILKNDETEKIKMAILPFIIESGEQIDILITTKRTDLNEENEEFITIKVAVVNNTGNTVDFERGKHHFLNINCDINSAQYVWWDGSGTELDPYQIFDKDDLFILSERVLAGEDQEGLYFSLMNDIDITQATENDPKWSGIGYGSTYFTDYYFNGCFDGHNHTITICNIDNGSSLFNLVGTYGIVKNVKTDGVINSAGVVSSNNGLVSYCSSTAEGCTSGVVGGNSGVVEYCTNKTSRANCKAGVVYYNYGTIKNCSNSGNLTGISSDTAGGIVAYNYSGTIINCLNSGNITKASNIDNIGGIAGESEGSDCFVVNCYNTGNISGYLYTGGIVGDVSGYSGKHGEVYNCYNVGTVSGGNFSDDIAGAAFDIDFTNCKYLCGWWNEDYLKNIDFVNELNTYVSEYNLGVDSESNQACDWVYVDGEYPMLEWESSFK